MKVFLSIKYHADHFNRERIEKVASTLERCGLTVTCIVRDIEQWGRIRFEPTELMRRTFAEIDASDWVVVDLTEKGVGVGIEAGYAYAKRIPILTVACMGADVSETLRGISQRVIHYDSGEDLAQIFSMMSESSQA